MAAYAALYSPYNDIDIYVEDKTLVGLYERICKRLIPTGHRVSAVIPLDGKLQVLSEARLLRGDNSRRRLFLLDGDFDWVLNRQAKIKDVYYLKCYSVENLAWELEAIMEAAKIFAPSLTDEQIATYVNEQAISAICTSLFPLFVVYAAVSKLNPTLATVSYSVTRLTTAAFRSRICDRRINARILQLLSLLRVNLGRDTIKAEMREIVSKFSGSYLDTCKIISGKDYLVPLIMFLFQDRFNFRGAKEQLLALLIDKAQLNNDSGLRKALLRRLN